MGTNINRLRKICSSMINYAKSKKGVIDAKGIADLEAIDARLGVLEGQQQATMEDVADLKARMDKVIARLHRSILRVRRILEAAAVGNPAGSSVPRASQGMYSASKIQSTALNHRQAFDKVASDVVSREVGSEFSAAIAEFAQTYESFKSVKDEWRRKKNVDAQEVATIGGKLWAYRTFAAYNVPMLDRKDLRARLRYVAPEKAARQKSETITPVSDSATTVALPALPAGTATAVPPSSEHPAMSANA